MKTFLTPLMLLHIGVLTVQAQQSFPLYKDVIPNSYSVTNEEVTEERNGMTIVSKITRPTLTAFIPSKERANGTAVVICPGGGYWVNAIAHEGYDVAKKFVDMGIAAFVLKYRIPNTAAMVDKRFGPLQDAQQAISFVRQNSKQWNINPDRIGMMGFSAGGHVASTAGTHFDKPVVNHPVSVRPDFMILIYPVISFVDSLGHIGSRDQLIGKTPDKEDILNFSNELQVTPKTPPTFLVHASDDNVVKSENSLAFYLSLNRHNVPAEMHIYQKGGHGFGMMNRATSDQWMDRLGNWLDMNGWLKK